LALRFFGGFWGNNNKKLSLLPRRSRPKSQLLLINFFSFSFCHSQKHTHTQSTLEAGVRYFGRTRGKGSRSGGIPQSHCRRCSRAFQTFQPVARAPASPLPSKVRLRLSWNNKKLEKTGEIRRRSMQQGEKVEFIREEAAESLTT